MDQKSAVILPEYTNVNKDSLTEFEEKQQQI